MIPNKLCLESPHLILAASCEYSKMMKTNIFQHIQNKAKWFFKCKYISLASDSWRDCTKLVEFSVVFKLCQYCVNPSSNFDTVIALIIFKTCQHCVKTAQDHWICMIQTIDRLEFCFGNCLDFQILVTTYVLQMAEHP